MKKFLLCLALTTSQVFAGSIVPNIRWNQILPNETGAAAALGPRNNISSIFAVDLDDLFNGSIDQSLNYGGLINFSKSDFVIEGALAKFNSQSSDTNFADIKGGLLLKKNISIGTGLQHLKSGDFESNTFKVNGVVNITSDIFIGGGINYEKNNTFIETDTSYFLGLGFMLEKKTTAEAVISFNPEESETKNGLQTTNDQEVSLTLEVIHAISNIQIEANASIEKNENSKNKTEEMATALGLKGEIQISPAFALELGLRFAQEKTEDRTLNEKGDSKKSGVNLGTRFNFSKFQVIAMASSERVLSDKEDSKKVFSLIGTYFF